MTVRTLVLGGLALVLVVGGLAALWFGVESIFASGPSSVLEEDLAAWNARRQWLLLLLEAGAPMVGAGLIAGVGALALVVRGRQVRRV
jgi:hypothetical protein